jgi:hypothetical protein
MSARSGSRVARKIVGGDLSQGSCYGTNRKEDPSDRKNRPEKTDEERRLEPDPSTLVPFNSLRDGRA